MMNAGSFTHRAPWWWASGTSPLVDAEVLQVPVLVWLHTSTQLHLPLYWELCPELKSQSLVSSLCCCWIVFDPALSVLGKRSLWVFQQEQRPAPCTAECICDPLTSVQCGWGGWWTRYLEALSGRINRWNTTIRPDALFHKLGKQNYELTKDCERKLDVTLSCLIW